MKRTARDNRPYVRPVERVELDEKHLGKRAILVVILLVIAGISLIYGLVNLTKAQKGWNVIEVNSSSQSHCGNEFTFLYNLGYGEQDATSEKKSLVLLYTDLCTREQTLFSNDQEYEGTVNIRTINEHPNEILTVDEELYRALNKIQSSDSRYPFLGPVYDSYDYIFFYDDENDLYEYDPHVNETLHQEYMDILSYAADPEHISLELLNGNQVILHVSEEYRRFHDEKSLNSYIDLYWMKNAFIIDDFADALIEAGFINGTISSNDGLVVRNLGGVNEDFMLNVYDHQSPSYYQAAVFRYKGRKSFATLHSFPMYEDDRYIRNLPNGEVRSAYLSMKDVLNHFAYKTLTLYDENASCSDLLLKMTPVYLDDGEGDLGKYFAVNENTIYTNDPSAVFTDLLENYQIKEVSR